MFNKLHVDCPKVYLSEMERTLSFDNDKVYCINDLWKVHDNAWLKAFSQVCGVFLLYLCIADLLLISLLLISPNSSRKRLLVIVNKFCWNQRSLLIKYPNTTTYSIGVTKELRQ